MFQFFLRRVLILAPVLWVILTLVFFMVRLAPGGPFDEERAVSSSAMERLREYYNLDAPLWRQYVDYLSGLARGNLGPSMRSTFSVGERIAAKLPVSVELGLYGLAVALTLGLGAGVIAASRANSVRDHAAMGLAMVGICVPMIVLGPVLVLIFAIHLEWLAPSGWWTASDRVLPALTLGIAYAAYIARLTRGGMLEVLSRDFIRTARAKGLSRPAVAIRHALRNGIQPVVNYLGPAAAGLLSGSFVVEQVFDVPGLGSEFVSAAQNRDYTMVLGTTLVYAVMILGFNLAVDLIQAWLDPRLRERA